MGRSSIARKTQARTGCPRSYSVWWHRGAKSKAAVLCRFGWLLPGETSYRLPETDLAHAILEIFGARQDFDFDAHEIDWQIAPIDFRKTHGILLRGDNCNSLALFAAVYGVEDLLLAEAMMVGVALRVNQFGALIHQALLEAFRLRDAAERGELDASDEVEALAFAGK